MEGCSAHVLATQPLLQELQYTILLFVREPHCVERVLFDKKVPGIALASRVNCERTYKLLVICAVLYLEHVCLKQPRERYGVHFGVYGLRVQ